MERRVFLKSSLATAIVTVVGGSLLATNSVYAAWPAAAMKEQKLDSAATAIAGSVGESSGDIKIKAPDIAENGAVVPITVDASGISDATRISVFTEKNKFPLTASFDLLDGAVAFVSTRIKMGKSSDVVALVEAGGKVLKAKKHIKVTQGGCGG